MKLSIIVFVLLVHITSLSCYGQYRALNQIKTSQKVSIGFEIGTGLALASELPDNMLSGAWGTGNYKIGGIVSLPISNVYKISTNLKLGLEAKNGAFYKAYYPDSNFRFTIKYFYLNPEFVYNRLLLGANFGFPFLSNLNSSFLNTDYKNIHNPAMMIEPRIGSIIWDISDNEHVSTKLNFNLGFPLDFVLKDNQESGFILNTKLINAHLTLSVMFNLLPNNVEPIIKKNYSKKNF